MGNLQAIHSVGNSLVSYLRSAYPQALNDAHACEFALFSSVNINEVDNTLPTTLSLYLYRVAIDEHLRQTSRQRTTTPNDIPLSLDLYYLLTVWSGSALAEQTILAWAMRELYMHPVLDRSALSPEADWNIEDVVRVIPSELSTEEMMRIWDALTPAYHLSVSYCVRVVQVDIEPLPDAPPVVATRFTYATREAEGRVQP